jgi:hypothetical protein
VKIRAINEADNWRVGGETINSPLQLERIRQALSRAPIIVERGLYRGGSAPEHCVFEEYEEFMAYLEAASAGDTFDVWSWNTVCKPELTLARGKCPDDSGRTPEHGAY